MRSKFLQQGLRSLLCFLTPITLTACVTTSQSPVQPHQSPNDDRQYRLLTLDNQLQVLLISDPSSPKAAASLDVNVGHGDNPPEREGLAHFLEHMLFLGTDKYPDPSEYQTFISEQGGSHNAYTSFEHTNYFFDIDAQHLPEALDRFAQFFVAPRFDAQYVDREKNAVQAEYQMGLKSDGRRSLDVLQEVMNPQHPFSQFTVGSLDSLADRPGSTVRDELLAFYETYYSANIMRLVVLGAQPLDELESLVGPMFSAVPNKNYHASEIVESFFTEGALPMMVEVKPQATLRQLQLGFPVGDYRDDYALNPLSYLGNLVGHEGEGSLLSQLKAEGLAESLAAGLGMDWPGGGLFNVTVGLTEAGVMQRERVLQLVFAYLKLLREQGPKEWLYSEQSQLAELGYRFQEKGSPMRYVSALSRGMHTYQPEDVLRGPYLMNDYQESTLANLMAMLVPSNALVKVTDINVETDRVSKRYEAPYSVQPVSGEELMTWMAPADDAGVAAMHLPAPNTFIAQNVSLVEPAPAAPNLPFVAFESTRQKIWFAQDKEFRQPKGATYINFRSPLVGKNVSQTATVTLYTALLKDQVNEYAYPARLAGLNFSLYKHAQGISLRLSGYNDKQASLLGDLVAVMATPEIDQERFENIRRDMIRGLENSVAKRPSSQVIDDLREALLYGEWGEEALIDALLLLQPADVVAYAKKFWGSATAEALIYGNYESTEVGRVSKRLASLLSTGPEVVIPPLRVLKLEASESILYPVDIKHDDTVLAWYLQGAGKSWSDRAAASLTGQIIKSGFFEQLRTEQQLGYVVQAFSWTQLDVPGLVMLIQSPVADAAKLANAMQMFVQAVATDVDGAQFERHKTALVKKILRPHKNLAERAEFYWQAIAKRQYEFDGRDALAEAVEAFTLETWQAYYQQNFIEQRRSLQVVAPGRRGGLVPGAQKVFSTAGDIKRGHATYSAD